VEGAGVAVVAMSALGRPPSLSSVNSRRRGMIGTCRGPDLTL
jgi:hypothetical protein